MRQDRRDIVEDLGRLIDQAAFDQSRWQAVADEFVDRMPGSRFFIQVVDHQLHRGVSALSSGCDLPLLREYDLHYGAINPLIPALIDAPYMTLLRSHELIPKSRLLRSEFYCDWLQKLGDADASTGIKLAAFGGRSGTVTITHTLREPERTKADRAWILNALAPRMKRALDIGRAATASQWSLEMGSFVQAIIDPAIFVTHDGKLVQANASAAHHLAQRDLLLIGPGDQVRFLDANLERRFRSGLHALSSRTGAASGSAPNDDIVVARSERCEMTMIGLRPDMLSSAGLPMLLAASGAALVVMKVRQQRSTGVVALLTSRYRLTRSELRLALEIDGSRPLTAVAADLGIGYETARTHLRNIRAKLGISRQSELVAVMLRLGRD